MKISHSLKDSIVPCVEKCLKGIKFNWDDNIIIGKAIILVMEVSEHFISKENSRSKNRREGEKERWKAMKEGGKEG